MKNSISRTFGTGRRALRTLTYCAFGLMTAAGAQVFEAPTPKPGLTPDAIRGKVLYTTYCAVCHGADLKGSDKGPPFLNRIYESSHHSDAAFQRAAKFGSRAHHWKFGDMPPIPQVTPDDVAHITAYVRGEQLKVGIR